MISLLCTLLGIQLLSQNKKSNDWASEASPTLGCSIEISRDIYVVGMSYVVCHMSVVCQINCIGGITYGPRACSKSFFWRLNQ